MLTLLFIASGFTYCVRNSKNLGDVAQQQATIERIRERLPTVRILAVANSMNDLPAISGVDMTYVLIQYVSGAGRDGGGVKRLAAAARALLLLWNAKRIAIGKRTIFLNPVGVEALKTVRCAHAVVVSGAGAFNDTFGASVGAIWALVLRVAHALEKPVVVSGQQIGPFKRWLPKMITVWGLNVAQVIGVRDPISLDTAVNIGLPSHRIVLTGDDAWCLKPCDPSEAKAILARLGIDGPYVAAQVRFDNATQWLEKDAQVLASVIDRVSELYDAPIVFLRTHYASDNDDLVAARSVQRHVKRPCHLLVEELSASQTKGAIALARAGIGVSYHFCVFSCSAPIDTVGLYKSKYMRQKMMGLSALSPENMIGIGLDEMIAFSAHAEKLERFVRRSNTQRNVCGQSKKEIRCFKSGAALDTLRSLLGQ